MKYQSKIRVFIVLSLLVSCSPVYKNSYEYVKPKNKSIRSCVAKCGVVLSSCTNICRHQNQMCRISNNVSMRRSVQGVGTRRIICSSSCNSCNVSYRQCYVNCGGEVITKKSCSAFCG